jgi:2-polyprenyl-3-methyl-5-hydroxy-6-metoxy-1,4-benzoquinol methylase
MDTSTQYRLLAINQQFYNQYSNSFSATRHQIQPGVNRVIESITNRACILDVGCGNGTLARALIEQRFRGEYLGVDMSEGLLAEAKQLTEESPDVDVQFKSVDLADPTWTENIPKKQYDWLVSFAVLHHIPGNDLRQKTVKHFRKLIAPGGRAAVSVWQWQNSPRLRRRVLPWSATGIEPEEVNKGDVLLDWRAGDTPGIRYVHTFSEESLTELAREAGFEVVETFYSDGKSGDLALYQVWK